MDNLIVESFKYVSVLIHVVGIYLVNFRFVKYFDYLDSKMVLDIDRFRPEKGGNPEAVKENQRKRFSDVAMVDKIVAADENWRKGE